MAKFGWWVKEKNPQQTLKNSWLSLSLYNVFNEQLNPTHLHPNKKYPPKPGSGFISKSQKGPKVQNAPKDFERSLHRVRSSRFWTSCWCWETLGWKVVVCVAWSTRKLSRLRYLREVDFFHEKTHKHTSLLKEADEFLPQKVQRIQEKGHLQRNGVSFAKKYFFPFPWFREWLVVGLGWWFGFQGYP